MVIYRRCGKGNMNIDWNRLRKGMLILFCVAAAAGNARSYMLGTASQEPAVLTQEAPQRMEYVPVNAPEEERFDLNAATFDQLCTLKGIGPVKAQAILDYRDAYGGFVCLEELMEVKGIGESTYAKIKEYLYISE